MNLLHATSYLATLAAFAAAIPQHALAQADDFDDGNADGWTEVAPLSGFGVTATYSFPGGNSYRMQSDPSPNDEVPPGPGPARLGSLREDVTYTDFYQFVDLVDYDVSLDQNIGMLARIKEPGLQTLDGYGVTFNPIDQAIFLTVITNEEGNNIGDADCFVDVGDPVRLVFQGQGGNLKFEVFTMDDLVTPVASIEVFDATYASGTSGIFTVTDGNDPPLPVDCTFDNYFAAAEKPFNFEIVNFEIAGDDLIFDFLSEPAGTYSLWSSDDLQVWGEETDSIPADLGTQTRFMIKKPEGVLRRYYQFRIQE